MGGLLLAVCIASTLMGCPRLPVAHIQAAFEAYTLYGYAPLEVPFTDHSTPGTSPIASWLWDFGDGSNSIEQNPLYTYTIPGIYTVRLTVMAADGSDDETKPNLITVLQPVLPKAAFSADIASGVAPLTVQFTDESEPGTMEITKWRWEFGDGETSQEQNPVHTYEVAGKFTVCLRVSSKHGTGEAIKEAFVEAAQLPEAAFTATPAKGLAPLAVAFTDASIAGSAVIDKWEWTFGDGGTSTEKNPSHTYVQPGKYTVSLNVTTDDGEDSETQVDCITVTTEMLTFGGSAADQAKAIVALEDGGVVLAGDTQSFGAVGQDAYLVRVDQEGVEQWSRQYGGPGDDFANALARTPEGGFILAGGATIEQAKTAYQGVYLVKTDSEGNRIWSANYEQSLRQVANAVAALSDGTFFAAGSAFYSSWPVVYLLRADALGNAVREYAPLDQVDSNLINGVAATSDGAIIAAGMMQTVGAQKTMYLLKTTVNGEPLWNNTFGEGVEASGMSVSESATGGFILAGSRVNPGNGTTDLYLVRTDGQGNEVWSTTLGGNGQDRARSVIETADGGIVMAGETSSSGAGLFDMYVVKLDSAGEVLWERTVGGPKSDTAYGVTETAEGGLAIAGSTESQGAGSLDMCLVFMNADGQPLVFFDDAEGEEKGEAP